MVRKSCEAVGQLNPLGLGERGGSGLVLLEQMRDHVVADVSAFGRKGLLSDGRVQSLRDVVDRRLLGLTDVVTMLPVSRCDLVGQGDDEPAIFFDLFRRRLGRKERDRITKVLQSVPPQLLGRAVVRVIPFRFRCDNLIQKFALAVLLACLDVGLAHRDGLAKRASSLGGDHD